MNRQEPVRMVSWWLRPRHLPFNSKAKEELQKRAAVLAEQSVNTAIIFGSHFRWDFAPCWSELHEIIAFSAEELHKYGIRLFDHHSSVLTCRYSPPGNIDGRRNLSNHKQSLLSPPAPYPWPKEDRSSWMMRNLTDNELLFLPQYSAREFCMNNPEFRSAYQYNNHMYIVLGYLLERLYGESWESLIKRKIADPLGVTDIRFRGQKGNMDNLERALPYGGTGFDAFRCNYSDSPISGPCGGIKVNLPNLLKWVMAMARGGVCESGKRLCSEKQYQEMITSLIPCTGNTHGFNGSCYAMAWHTGVYNNQPIVFHSGGLTGFTTQVGFLPGKNCGYAMIFNTGSTPASETIRRMALDLLTAGQLNEDHYIEVIDDWKVARDKMVESVNKAKGTPCTAVSDPQLIGSYEHPAYEVFDIAEKDGGLWFLYGDFKAPIVRNAEGKLSAYEKTLDGLAPDHVDLEEVDGGLKLHDSDSALWMSFKKIC